MDIRGWAKGNRRKLKKKKTRLDFEEILFIGGCQAAERRSLLFWIIIFIFGFQHGPGHMKNKRFYERPKRASFGRLQCIIGVMDL